MFPASRGMCCFIWAHRTLWYKSISKFNHFEAVRFVFIICLPMQAIRGSKSQRPKGYQRGKYFGERTRQGSNPGNRIIQFDIVKTLDAYVKTLDAHRQWLRRKVTCSFSRKFRKYWLHSSLEIPRNSNQDWFYRLNTMDYILNPENA